MKNAPYAKLIDTTLCTGCELCVEACKETNQTGHDEPQRWKQDINDLSSTRFTTIVRRSGNHNVRRSCRHCSEPACASACIVGALQKTPEGATIYDEKKCMGCRYCMVACPFGIPRYNWESAAPIIRKCTLCHANIKSGKLSEPACVTACPQHVSVFGPRDQMLNLAKERIRSNPGKYFKDHIYGEKEVGGTNVLLISDIDLSFLGWKPGMNETPLPDLTWAALSKVPPVVIGMGAFATAAYWVIGRRMKLAHEAASHEEQHEEQ